ncbi:alpha/beta fold hydrolase [Thalassotalea ganghwensis]
MNLTEEVSYQLGDQTLRGIAWGDEQAPLLLCLHGWLDNAASFVPLADYLTDYRVIAIDWPGHGFSSHRSIDAHYHFIDYVYDLVKLFELNGWRNIDIVGHSMGGMIATAFAAAFPENIRSLTLLDSIGFISGKEEQTTRQLREGMLSRLSSASKRKRLHPSIASAVEARMAVSDLTKENAALIVKRGVIKTDDGFTWSADPRLRMTSPYRLTLAQAKQFIADLKMPVQLIYGDKGLEMVTTGINEFGPLFKNIVLKKLSGGHHIHMEQPEQTATEISTFIRTNPCNN